jgi:hypothetical protein
VATSSRRKIVPSSELPFEIRYRASGDSISTALTQSVDANAATVAFHTALEHLGAEACEGDVLLVKYDPVRHVVLTQPLAWPMRAGDGRAPTRAH